MDEWIYLTVGHVREIHAAALSEQGGSDGLRDLALLESAVAAPQATAFGEPLLKDPIEIAGAYLYYICRNHPFVDGNKRAAFGACLVFLRMNHFEPAPDSSEWESPVLGVAASKLDRDQMTVRLRKLVHARRRKKV